MGNFASPYSKGGQREDADELQVEVQATSLGVLAAEHSDTPTSMGTPCVNLLALTYWSQGRWKEAEELQVEVQAPSFRVLRDEHPATLKSIGNLASTSSNQGTMERGRGAPG